MNALPLGPLCSKIGSGATPRGGKEVYQDSGEIALIRSQNVYNEGFSRDGLAYIRPEHAQQLQNVEVLPGDVLLNITGDSVARVCQVPNDVLPARVNQHVAIIRANVNELDARFLRFYLASPHMQAYMLAFAAAGATRNALTKGMIEHFPRPDHSIAQQREIGKFLGALEDKIDLNRRMNETLEAMARAIFKDWFVDFGPVRAKAEGRQPPGLSAEIAALFPDALDDEDKPVGWASVPVRQLIDFNPTERIPVGQMASYLDMAALPTSGTWSDHPISRAFAAGSKFRNGDVLLARITPCLENGKSAFVQSLDVDEIGWGSTEFIVMRTRPPLPSAYGYLLCRDRDFRERAIRSMTGTSGRQRVQVDSLTEYLVTKPSEEKVFRAFGEIITPWFDMIPANSLQIETLSRLRDLLLPKLMSGEIRLREAEQAVEAVL